MESNEVTNELSRQNNIFPAYSKEVYERLKDDNLKLFKTSLTNDNIDLILNDEGALHDMNAYFMEAVSGDINSYKFMSVLSYRYSNSNDLRAIALDGLKLLSHSNSTFKDQEAQYYYALSLWEEDQKGEALNILEWLACHDYPPALCRLGVYKMLGFGNIEQDLVEARNLLQKAAETGHLRGKLFLTRLKRKHGNYWEKLTWLFSIPRLIIYKYKLGNSENEPTHLVY